MGDLPESRVTPSLPFMNIGVDYAGPFTVRDRRGRGFKTYVSPFICLCTKAIHLELVTNLSSDAFIAALKRFESKRVEDILNSRPLTLPTLVLQTFKPLTLAHFPIGCSVTSIPELNFMDVRMNRLSHFERLQQLRQHLWRRWSVEYVSVLEESNLSPLQWKLGRVTQLYSGSDGFLHVATLRTGRGDIRRAIYNQCPLSSSIEAVPAEAVLKDHSFKLGGMSNSTLKSAPMIARSICPKAQ
ncbi:hypothetical protein JTB14_026466 [Gonioctena quinquepunctata]|nr:hypothetical protein JTB14_026466 [Gonioctena quinquepunctata]